MNARRRQPPAPSLATLIAIDASCLAVSGGAGLLAFALAWLILRGSGVI